MQPAYLSDGSIVFASDGRVIVAHAPEQGDVQNLGTATAPIPNYRFRLRLMVEAGGGLLTAGAELKPGISQSISFRNPDQMVGYNGALWERSPAVVRARSAPASTSEPPLAAAELTAFAAAGLAPSTFRRLLARNGLRLIVVRNNSSRDDADRQQLYEPGQPAATHTPQALVAFLTQWGQQRGGLMFADGLE